MSHEDATGRLQANPRGSGDTRRLCVLLLALWCVVASRSRAADARVEAAQQRLAAIWAKVNQEWRDHGQKLVTKVEVMQPPSGEGKPTAYPLPAGYPKVESRDGVFLRNGRPAFLVGVEGRMYDGAWINRVLGIDLFNQHAGMVWWRSATQVKESPGPGGGVKLTVAFRDYPWARVLAREALRGGTLFAVDYYLCKGADSNLNFKKYRFSPRFFGGPKDYGRGTSHFLNLCLENPDARDYYVSQYWFVARLLRGCPVFHHELVNEVKYQSYWPGNIAAFQQRMQAKYGNIATANRAWHTAYHDFSEVIPPISNDPSWFWFPPTKARGWPWGPLVADWNAFMAAHAGNVFKRLRRAAEKSLAPAAPRRPLFTIQSPNCLGGDPVLPPLKVAAEDVFGHEAFFYPYRAGPVGKEDWSRILALMSLQFRNDIVRNASPVKPIFNLEAPWVIKDARYDGRAMGVKQPGAPATPNFMRMFLWHQLVHGLCGTMVSYFYGNECSHGGYSVWDPRVMTRATVRELPRVKAEIRDLAEVVVPRPRIRGRLGVMYWTKRLRRDNMQASLHGGNVF